MAHIVEIRNIGQNQDDEENNGGLALCNDIMPANTVVKLDLDDPNHEFATENGELELTKEVLKIITQGLFIQLNMRTHVLEVFSTEI